MRFTRNRLSVERAVFIHSYAFTPYLRAEAYYDSHYSKWSATLLTAGVSFPIKFLSGSLAGNFRLFHCRLDQTPPLQCQIEHHVARFTSALSQFCGFQRVSHSFELSKAI